MLSRSIFKARLSESWWTTNGGFTLVGGTKSCRLYDLAVELHLLALKLEVTLTAVYILGHRNVMADALPRQRTVQHLEWSLAQDLLQPVFSKWGQP